MFERSTLRTGTDGAAAVRSEPASHAPRGAGRTEHSFSRIAVEAIRPPVTQLRKCIACPHDHDSVKCTKPVPDPANAGQTKKCGCTSHSSSWKNPPKGNPKGGRHNRLLKTAQGTAM